MEGKLIIFSAPSGSGKTTIVKELLARNANLGFSISACTRDKRGRHEEHGKDYYFLTPDDFRERIANERPVLGICIGMQILFSRGTEHSENGIHAGVGVWDAEVSKLNAPILPHMGWNTIDTDSGSILFKGVEDQSFYFVHSFAAKSAVGKMQSWSTHGEKFLASVEDGYVSATQFHPEKSGDAGLALIKNWTQSL